MNSTEISDTAEYVVIDIHAKRVVYRTTWKNRNRARRWADRKDMEYGAIKHICKLS